MKNKEFLVKAQRGGVSILSADGKIEHAFVEKFKNGRVVRTFYASVCDGILIEGTHCSDIRKAVRETEEIIKTVLDIKKPGK